MEVIQEKILWPREAASILISCDCDRRGAGTKFMKSKPNFNHWMFSSCGPVLVVCAFAVLPSCFDYHYWTNYRENNLHPILLWPLSNIRYLSPFPLLPSTLLLSSFRPHLPFGFTTLWRGFFCSEFLIFVSRGLLLVRDGCCSSPRPHSVYSRRKCG